jgi:hypothetical protein
MFEPFLSLNAVGEIYICNNKNLQKMRQSCTQNNPYNQTAEKTYLSPVMIIYGKSRESNIGVGDISEIKAIHKTHPPIKYIYPHRRKSTGN